MTDFRRKQKDFLEFLQADSFAPPEHVEQRTQQQIARSLRREGPVALAKFLFCHVFAAALTLSICPQFGLGPVFANGLSHYFMAIGTWACALWCSAIFFGTGALACKLVLNIDESRRLLPSSWYLSLAYCFAILLILLAVSDTSQTAPMFFEAEYIAIWLMSGLMIVIAGLRLQANQGLTGFSFKDLQQRKPR
ncbi:MAG: hypothetical protein ACOH5I_00360 [Oligoflexus sp.]